MLRLWLNRVFMLLVALGVAGAIVYALLPQPIAADLASVARGPLRVTVDEDGRTRLRDRFVVSMPLAGRMQRIDLEPGDAVEAGDILTVITPTDPSLLDLRDHRSAEARVRAAAAVVRRAEAQQGEVEARRDLAAEEYERVRDLYYDDAATRRELDQAMLAMRATQREYEAAEFSVEVARFELDLARAALLRMQVDEDVSAAEESDADEDGDRDADAAAPQRLEIRAPVDGRVLRVEQESEAVLDPGRPIVEIGDPQRLEIEIDVLSTDAVRIEAGDPALIEHWGGETALEAAVRRIDPQAFTKVSALGVEEQRVNIILDFTSPAELWRRLGDGYRVEARIVVWEDDDVVKVPTSALFRHGDGWAVFTVIEDRARLQPVRIGRGTGLETQVLEGLQENDTVIAHPSDRITHNTRITPR